MHVLIIGGYGTFGGRLVDLLKGEPRFTIGVAGRSLTRATTFCAARGDARARLVPLAFDRTGDVHAQLQGARPDVIVDASGPFQSYGDTRYELIRASIALRIHYMDLADGAEFVAGVAEFDAEARAAGIAVLSGVSSFPVLTAAVVRHLSSDFERVTGIEGGIAPSPFAQVGENVVRAIAGYAGQRVLLRRRGKVSVGYPFTETRRVTVAPPGGRPLRSTLFSLVDVPDLRVLAALWPDAEDVWMGAGPVPATLHRALRGLSWLVRWRLLPSVLPLAPIMVWVMNHLRWGAHRGGMYVQISGLDRHGRALQRSWHLLAEGDDGPLIPCMAVEALLRRALAGRLPAAGARAATGELELADYAALVTRRAICWGTRDDTSHAGLPLFAQLLGSAWDRLPVQVRALHDGSDAWRAEGRCTVERGTTLLSHLVARVFGFPRAGEDVPVAVQFSGTTRGERWCRRFDRSRLSSRLSAGDGRSALLLIERFGPCAFAQALVLEGDTLRYELRHWTCCGIPMPRWLAPRSDSFECEREGRFQFHVDLRHPWLGLIVRYRGWLERVDGTAVATACGRSAAERPVV